MLALAVALIGCGDGRGGHEYGGAQAAPVAQACAEAAEGCACAGNQPPVPCVPEGATAAAGYCLEGTRRCVQGRFGACQDARAFPVAAPAQIAALVDPAVQHARCSDCEPSCFRVTDNFDPADGALAGAFASGVQYHSSGAGLMLTPNQALLAPGPPPEGLPAGALYLQIPEGLTASASAATRVRPAQSDVYLLLDHSPAMAEATLWLHDAFDTGALLPAGTSCASGDDALLGQGVSGALRCAIPDTELGLGVFRDIPFEPYAADQTLPAAERALDARLEIAFRNHARQSADLASVRAAFGTLGGAESSGDPDLAGSQIVALYSLATGEGVFTGLGRTAVPAAQDCEDERFGYSCFREGSSPVVVLVTGAPLHNGPDPGSFAYDYDPAQLTMQTGTVAGVTAVPASNDDWSSAHAVAGDAGSSLALYEGTTAGLGNALPAGAVSCGAHTDAPNAVFRFHVDAPGAAGSTVPVTLSTEGSSFATALAVLTRAVTAETLPAASDENELFSSAGVLGDVAGRHVIISGDTEKPSDAADMSADYQGSLYGASCGAHTLAPDAAYRFDIGASAGARPLEVSLDMGSDRGVLSVHEAGAVAPPAWPAITTTHVVTSDEASYPTAVYEIPSGAGNEYVTVRGDTTALAADLDASLLGGATCAPDSTSPDDVLRIHLDAARTLRFDTEGSSFDTVLSLHEAPPLTTGGASRTWTAAETHDNTNESGAFAWDTGSVNNLRQILEGDTSGMVADVTDTFGCGMENACGDAVYQIEVSARTTLRLQVEATAASAVAGFEPAVVVTRADPGGVSGRHAPLALGAEHGCALSDGEVFCWGADAAGQLGNGGAAGDPDSLVAVPVTALTDVVQVAAGRNHACAVTGAGGVHCWGAGSAGQLGDGASVDRHAPVPVAGLGTPGNPIAVQVACGTAHCCALRNDGGVVCWGADAAGQLGNGGALVSSAIPLLVAGGHVFEQLVANGDHTCAIRASDDAVLCWGEGGSGQMGDGATDDNTVPARVNGLSSVTHVMAGQEHNCAVLSSGRVSCWGGGADGRLGQGSDVSNHATPVMVRNHDGDGLLGNAAGGWAAGRAHTCITTLDGFVHCWGDNASSQLGNGGSADAHLPVGVAGLRDAVHVVSAHDHSCALRAEGSLMCWGAGGHGRLGSGSTSTPLQPVRALAGTPHVAFGNGTIDAAFTQACRSRARMPEVGCERRTRDGDHYFVCPDHPRTWAGAFAACVAAGYGLVEIDEPGENAFVAAGLAGRRAWIGAKRESSADWLELDANLDFENTRGTRVWHTEEVGHEQCDGSGSCYFEQTVGWFTPAAAPDLVDSDPYTNASTWYRDDQPSPAWGHNCVTLDEDGKWETDACSAVPAPPGSGADVGALFAAPHFAGGVENHYVCEERGRTTDVTLDPGLYYVTVKGSDDGDATTACSGGYALHIDDLGSPTGAVLGCDDNGVAESTASVLERTLAAGDYYLVVQGKRAVDRGAYQLTVRDVGAVPPSEVGCDASGGAGDPALVTFTGQPGRSYYALVKGAAPVDKGAYTLQVRDGTEVGSALLGCDAGSGPGGSSQLEVPLATGDYFAVIKGRGASESGDYRLTVGGAAPLESTFVPPSYERTVDALGANGMRVATVLACSDGDACDDASAQAQALADDTHGVVRSAASAADVPAEVVRAVQLAEALDEVRGELLFAPDENPGFTFPVVVALPDPNNLCSPGSDAASLRDCVPGATPSFRVSLTNPALAPVPPPMSMPAAYALTLRITGERDGEVVMEQDVPVLVAPTGTAPPGSYDSGSYHQDVEGRACTNATQRPSWDQLTFDADVRPDTRVSILACTANTAEDLQSCEDGADSSGYRRVVTITAGTGAGTPCTVATQASDCPSGYCSPYTHVCNELEGAPCMNDDDCPGTAAGRCRAGSSVVQLGTTCRIDDLAARPASVLGQYNYLPFMRVRLELDSEGDGSRTPSVFFWEALYRCRNVE